MASLDWKDFLKPQYIVSCVRYTNSFLCKTAYGKLKPKLKELSSGKMQLRKIFVLTNEHFFVTYYLEGTLSSV